MIQPVPLALVVAMVCIIQTAAVADTFPTDEDKPDDVSCDFARVGARNIWAGLTGAFARQASCYFRMGWMGLKTSLDGLQGESR
jgi:MFS superfamily sulfate permease-like transporter